MSWKPFSYLWSYFTSFLGSGGEHRFDDYRPKERKIYRYWNGKKYVEADPMVLYKRMMEVKGDLTADQKLARSISKDALKGHTAMLTKIRNIFEVDKYEDGGLTEAETSDLLDHFMIYCHWVKKNSSPSAISPEATSPTSPPSSVENPSTSSISDSGSTEDEKKTDEPESSPTAPESV